MIFKNSRKQHQIQRFVEPYKRHGEDVGSSIVQIARLTHCIKEISKHLQSNKKDLHSIVGLKKQSSRRKKLLIYLKRSNEQEYNRIIEELSLRHS